MKIGTRALEKAPSQQVIDLANDCRSFVIGDLDGDLLALKDALDRVNFDPHVDHLFCLGDVIDRGEKSYDLFHYIEELGAHMVLGNHEHLMLESIINDDKEALSIW